MSQNTMIYLAVDKDKGESVYSSEPQKRKDGYWECIDWAGGYIQLPTGTIKKLTGKDLKWEDGYIQYVGDNYDPTNE